MLELSRPFLEEASTSTVLQSAGMLCHIECGGRIGPCPGFCGSAEACCRHDFDIGSMGRGNGARGFKNRPY